MATTEPEPPPLTAVDIANRTFARRRKGVNPDEVQAFLLSLGEHVARLQAQVEWHRARVAPRRSDQRARRPRHPVRPLALRASRRPRRRPLAGPGTRR